MRAPIGRKNPVLQTQPHKRSFYFSRVRETKYRELVQIEETCGKGMRQELGRRYRRRKESRSETREIAPDIADEERKKGFFSTHSEAPSKPVLLDFMLAHDARACSAFANRDRRRAKFGRAALIKTHQRQAPLACALLRIKRPVTTPSAAPQSPSVLPGGGTSRNRRLPRNHLQLHSMHPTRKGRAARRCTGRCGDRQAGQRGCCGRDCDVCPPGK